MGGGKVVGFLEAGEDGAVFDEFVDKVVVGGWGWEEGVSGGYGERDGFDEGGYEGVDV